MKIHPLTIIILGFLIISVLFNISQSRSYSELKKEVSKQKGPIIIVPKKEETTKILI